MDCLWVKSCRTAPRCIASLSHLGNSNRSDRADADQAKRSGIIERREKIWRRRHERLFCFPDRIEREQAAPKAFGYMFSACDGPYSGFFRQNLMRRGAE